MEVFLEFLCTIVLSVLLSFFISKLLSWDPTGDHAVQPDPVSESKLHVIDETTKGDCNATEECPRSLDTEIDKEPPARSDGKLAVHEEVEVDGGDAFVNGHGFDDLKVQWQRKCGGVVGVENFGEVDVGGGENSVGECVNVIEDNLVDEIPERMRFCEIGTKSVNDDVSLVKHVVSVAKNAVDDNESFFDDDDDDDDWEGVQRSELEKQFGEAVAFVRRRSDSDCMSELGSDVQMQLYGLHKVSTEGSCNEPQPMAFKMSARAKWY